MKIHGKEIKFLRTVKATSDIAKLCPNGDINRIEEVFSEKDIAGTIENGAKLIHFLNEGYEMNKHFEDPSYQPNIISVEEILYLDDATYTKLIQSAMKDLNNGAETSIEVEESKKKGGNHEGVD